MRLTFDISSETMEKSVARYAQSAERKRKSCQLRITNLRKKLTLEKKMK